MKSLQPVLMLLQEQIAKKVAVVAAFTKYGDDSNNDTEMRRVFWYDEERYSADEFYNDALKCLAEYRTSLRPQASFSFAYGLRQLEVPLSLVLAAEAAGREGWSVFVMLVDTGNLVVGPRFASMLSLVQTRADTDQLHITLDMGREITHGWHNWSHAVKIPEWDEIEEHA